MNFSAGINNGNEGLYWLKRIREIAPALPVVMLTAYGDVELAVKALKNDATDFLLKPWDNRTLVRKIKDAFGSGKKRKNRIPDRNKSPMIVGTSPAMQQLMKIVVKVARTDANILITGENGTGKEMLAQEIHRLSTRKEHSMVTVDMGAISESLFESEPPVNDTTTYDNGTGVIPSYLCEPVFADASNYKELLIDSGYYTEADLQ